MSARPSGSNGCPYWNTWKFAARWHKREAMANPWHGWPVPSRLLAKSKVRGR